MKWRRRVLPAILSAVMVFTSMPQMAIYAADKEVTEVELSEPESDAEEVMELEEEIQEVQTEDLEETVTEVQEMAEKSNTKETSSGNPILYWDMTTDENGKLVDSTGNGHLGTINDQVTSTKIDGIDVLDMAGGYVDIPDGTISTSDTELTINMLVKIKENIPASWMWTLGSSARRYMYFTGCCSTGQGSVMRGGVGCVPSGSDAGGWSYESVINGSEPLTINEWQNVTVTYKDGGNFTFYKNGVYQNAINLSEGNAGIFTLQDLMVAGDGRDGYMGWSFYTGADPKFQGTVADFRIYNSEMTGEQVGILYQDISDMLETLKESDFSESDIHLSEANCLGVNPSKDEISTDLNLPMEQLCRLHQKSMTIL